MKFNVCFLWVDWLAVEREVDWLNSGADQDLPCEWRTGNGAVDTNMMIVALEEEGILSGIHRVYLFDQTTLHCRRCSFVDFRFSRGFIWFVEMAVTFRRLCPWSKSCILTCLVIFGFILSLWIFTVLKNNRLPRVCCRWRRWRRWRRWSGSVKSSCRRCTFILECNARDAFFRESICFTHDSIIFFIPNTENNPPL